MNPVRIGIIICNRYKSCAAGKCLRALKNREGAFSVYAGKDVELVGYTSCGGCPGGNVEYTGDEMVKNGASVIHLATGMIVGYPPCPGISVFKEFLEKKYNVKVIVGTHPVPQKYFEMHSSLGSWKNSAWKQLIDAALSDETTRISYN
ncbi:MAG: CGGC domain-containing protein [Spirochaetota bacterium]